MFLHVINTTIIINGIIYKLIFVSKTVFSDVNLLVVWIIIFHSHDLVIQAFRINNPVPIRSRHIIWCDSATNTFNLVLRTSFFTLTIVNDFSLTIKGLHPITHVVVDTKEIVQIFSCFKCLEVFITKIKFSTIFS